MNKRGIRVAATATTAALLTVSAGLSWTPAEEASAMLPSMLYFTDRIITAPGTNLEGMRPTVTFTKVEYPLNGTSGGKVTPPVDMEPISLDPGEQYFQMDDYNINMDLNGDKFVADKSYEVHFPAVESFERPGIYEYIMKMEQPSSTAVDWTNSREEYLLQLFIVRSEYGDGQLQYHDSHPYLLTKIKDADGHELSGEDQTKVSFFESGYSSTEDSALWTHQHESVQSLRVTKEVSGPYGDPTYQFPFKIRVYEPDSLYAPQMSSVSYTVNNANSAPRSGSADIVTHPGYSRKYAEFEVSLADGDYVEFSVPAGYYYGVEEVADSNGAIADNTGIGYNTYITAEPANNY